MDLHPFEIAALLLGAGVLGALLPLYRRWSERGLHVFVALATGVFLGTIFLHLLPHLAGVGEHAGETHVQAAGEGGLGPWIAALAGLLLLFALEKVWLPTLSAASSSNPHVVLWSATYVGLSLHALTAGVSLSAVLDDPVGRTQLLISLLIHKATETFSLATVMRLAGLSRGRMLSLIGLFVTFEPGAFLLGREMVAGMPAFDSLLTGFACGTFLYVAVCDLLPEVFHGHDRPGLKLAAVLVGIAITAVTMPFLASAGGFLQRALAASLDVFLDLAPFLLLGLFLAGLSSLVLARVRLARKIAGNDLKSVLWAALFGAPLPLCSCSVVPVAVSLRRSGASKGATSAFAISTPETGVDSLAVSFVLLDPLLAIARPIGAFLSAVASGVAVNGVVRSGLDDADEPRSLGGPSACAHGDEACAGEAAEAVEGANAGRVAEGESATAFAGAPVPAPGHAYADAHGHAHAHAHGHAHGPAHGHAHEPTVAVLPKVRATLQPLAAREALGAPTSGERSWFARVLRYAYVTMLDDLAASLVVGVLLSGAIVAALPASILESPLASGIPGLFLMLVVGVPLYVCALSSTPIAAALIAKGLSPGAAFVFLLAGPATNAATLLMLAKVLGRRVVLVQLAALALAVVTLGWFIDRLYPWLGRVPSAPLVPSSAAPHGWVAIVSAAVLAGLLLAALFRVYRLRELFGVRRESV